MMSLLWASVTLTGCCFLTIYEIFFAGATVLMGCMNSSIPWLFYIQNKDEEMRLQVPETSYLP